jgi:GT2 family glycosyltransferase
MKSIAVLMACFNRKEKTINCLRALSKQQLDKNYILQVYLLNDGSTDGTGEAVKKEFPSVKIINGDGSLYWNRGMHTAWKVAAIENYDYYLWLNDDTNLYPYAVKEMLSAALLKESKAIICGCTESPKIKGQLTYGGGKHRGKVYISNYPYGIVAPCDIINGNCVLVPKYVFEKVGNLDWTFSHSIGDNDYSLRSKKKGISSFTAAQFIGTCAKHDSLPKWCLPQIPIKDRIKNLYSPLGNPPKQYFIFERRHFGLFNAFKHYLSTHIRVFMPKLWM